jgi:RNA 3'-terminal phosphate cyclase (ATP)
VRVQGGTHNPAAPPFEFLARSFTPQLARMGLRVELELVRHGFYPAGGGEIVARIQPRGELPPEPFALLERGEARARLGEVLLAFVPHHVAEVEARSLASGIGIEEADVRIDRIESSIGPGNAVSCTLAFDDVSEVVTAFGARGISAKRVVRDVVRAVQRYSAARAPVGEHLADQLLMPLALTGGGTFRAVEWSSHARTNAATLAAFLGDVCAVEGGPRDVTVVVAPRGT